MKKRKILAMLCVITMSVSFAGCGAAEDVATQNIGAVYEGVTNMASEKGMRSNAMAEAPAEAPAGDIVAPDFNTEEYNYIKENSFLSVANSPLSTFAADVDTGSYTNLRRMIKDNCALEDIPQGAVRTEELINYFDYEVTETEDDNTFAVSYEIGTCPWNEENELLMMTVKAKDTDIEHNGNNFVFLIDSSGSMNKQDKGVLAIKSFKLLAETLSEDDMVSIVTYSGDSRVVLDSCAGNNYKKICNALDSIEFGGGTNGSGGITAAYELAEDNFIDGGNNRVIIASDGDMNLGVTSNAGLVDLIKEKKETGVFLTVLGYGSGNYSDANMESLADNGNGNYYYIDCIDEADRVLVEKLKQTTLTVAKDVKLQVEFNPLEVCEYRLIGYENRTMAAEDFEDDTKDGGETGAGQTVTVLYELACNDDENEGSGLKYQTDREVTESALSGELLTLSVRYKDPDAQQSVEESFVVMGEDKDELSEDLSFVAGVAELSMILNDSEYLGTASLDSAYELVTKGCADDKYREELADMIKTLNY
ncbi:MAG: von Willebrand factor type A domain-containing protein [Lachnospiraceae bacterium]|nr:von Willebrand factor type A domain-containing protein [Lachnospiraceae bacterium]